MKKKRRRKKRIPSLSLEDQLLNEFINEGWQTLVMEVQEHLGEGFDPTILIGRPQQFPEARDYAFAEMTEDGSISVVVSPGLLVQDTSRMFGVLMHEMGHCIDFFLGKKMANRFAASLGVELLSTPERRADQIAGAVWEVVIFYDVEDVQSLDDQSSTTPRPARLGL
jgi:hypothetical protein